jgi:hypothetical protein
MTDKDVERVAEAIPDYLRNLHEIIADPSYYSKYIARVAEARAALTSTDAVTDIAKLGTVSLTSFDGHCVRIDFPNREDAERMYAVLTGAPGNG